MSNAEHKIEFFYFILKTFYLKTQIYFNILATLPVT